jgi:hypothetical protein
VDQLAWGDFLKPDGQGGTRKHLSEYVSRH